MLPNSSACGGSSTPDLTTMLQSSSPGRLADVLVTDELARRPPRRANHEAENRALRQLARNMAGRPDVLLSNLVDIAVELCRAGTAGVSLLQRNVDGEQVFVWVALAGAYAELVGETMPAQFSLSRVCLERQAAQLYAHPDRYCTGYGANRPGIVELLVVPFPAGSRPLGTIWIASHDEACRFDSEDVRVLTGLADFTSAALRVASVVPGPTRSGPVVDGVPAARSWPTSKAQVALELDVMNRLHDFSTRLLGTQDLAATLDEVLHAAIAMFGADRGDIKLFDAEHGVLRMAAHQGFAAAYLEHFAEVPIHAETACARAVARGERVVLDDIREDPRYQAHLEVSEAAGFLAVQATPLISRDGRALGVLSTHFRQPGRPSDRELRMLDLYARHAADHVDMLRTQHELREAAERERKLLNQARARTQQLQSLTEASGAIAALSTVEDVLRATAERAREIIPAHQAQVSFVGSRSIPEALQAASYSERYAEWQAAEPPPIGNGFDLLVLRTNRPLRLTQTELEAHSAWPGACAEPALRPALRGWLGVPLIGRDGRNLGLIQLSDRHAGEFSDSDEAMLVQLAQLAAGALENARLYEALRAADRRKDEFLAMLSHELRNPLAPLLTALDLIGDEHNCAEVRREALNVTRRQILHVSRLVDDLLEMSRITTGKIRLRRAPSPVDGNELVERAVERLRPLIDQKRQALEVMLAPAPVWLDVDPGRIEQVLGNLLDNASKYTPAGGGIWVSVVADPDHVAFSIRDDGAGIDAELRPQIFDLFTQADKSLDRSAGGLGIGLALAKQIVELSGGTIDGESEGCGFGSEFTVRLPLAPGHGFIIEEDDDDERDAAVTAPEPDDPGSILRILVVDDGHDAAQMLSMLLRSWSHEVCVAHDGHAAIEQARAFRPQVILLDIGLPLMDGYEVARRIRADLQLQDVRLIALTGYGQAADRQRSQAAGFDLHLVKPVDTAKLAELLRPGPDPTI
jgi:signal transduction histidine kinase